MPKFKDVVIRDVLVTVRQRCHQAIAFDESPEARRLAQELLDITNLGLDGVSVYEELARAKEKYRKEYGG